MAVRSSFFNSVNGDRRYKSNHFAEYFASFIANGIFPNPSNTLQVYEKTNMTVTVKPGKGWINGYFAINEYDYDLTLDNADGILNRIDRIVLRLDFNARSIDLAVKKGAFASAPVAPILQRDADAHELTLADIYVTKGTTFIRQSNIADQRLDKALCGVVHGTVSQVDTTTIFNQYSAWFAETTGKTESEISQWQLTVKAEFDEWFVSIQNILDGDVAANLAARITTLEQNLATHQAEYEQFKTSIEKEVAELQNANELSVVKSGKDSEGIFTIVTYKRKSDNTIFAKSVLSGGTSPQYTTRTLTFYNADGITVKATKIYMLSYDSDGDLVSEV